MTTIFEKELDKNGYLLLDGAMGTMLMAAGLEAGASPELMNVEQPAAVQQVHRAYIEAGSQLILTNSFGGNHFRLKLHGLTERVYELNRAAAKNGRLAADGTALVAGSMGPTGELLAPLGEMSFDEARAAFAAQVRGLADGGVDLLWVETMSDLNEVKAAVEGARQATDLPIAATLSFDTNGRTMMGVTAVEAIKALQPYGLAALGANCGSNLPDTMAAVSAMQAIDSALPLIAKGNAGIPYWGADGELVYDGTPRVMAGYAYHVRQMGAQLIGACCGSTPAHIRAMGAALAGETPVEALVRPVAAARASPVEAKERRHGRRRRR